MTSEQTIINVVNRYKDEVVVTVRSIPAMIVGNKLSPYEVRDAYLPETEQLATRGTTIHHSVPTDSFTPIVVGVERPLQ